ncbi:ABC transporter substrate-binding protein [Streptomyces sp. BE303]|uniref:ABC transporter substrate-binding protein n=1 Tax=Streptomyces sp. BE303 TaxID=3002528 RepID=UPI002E776106|nr:ABC transporter substrate-binding protein [Streptomyces sp. BE303]MED7955362.1 ABC transporter substrate-binding protein [Streptomyces sp. BE303]
MTRQIASPDHNRRRDTRARGPRGVLAALLTTVLIAAAAACTTSSDGSASDSRDPSASSNATRVVSTPDGDVTVPAKPKRIIGLSYAAAWLLDSGIPMVGVTSIDDAALSAEQKAKVKEIPLVGEGNELNFEKIASLTPDLIIISAPKRVQFQIDKLKPIAPVVSFGIGNPDELLATTLKVTDAAGRPEAGLKVKKEYEDKAARIKTAYADKLAKTSWAIVNSGESGKFSAYNGKSWLGLVLKDVGGKFAALPGVGFEDAWADLSYEEIGKLDGADVILVDGDEPGTKPSAETTDLMNQTNWKSLKAAKAQQVHPVPAFFTSRYPEAGRILDQLEQILKTL